MVLCYRDNDTDLSQTGKNRGARMLTTYEPKATRAPRMTTVTTQNRTDGPRLWFASITTTPCSIGIPLSRDTLGPVSCLNLSA